MTCSAKRTNGLPCKAQAIAGAKVCRVHGGSAPQVREAAKRRLLAAVEPALARLVVLALNEGTEPKDAIAAIKDILNRAGIDARPEPVEGGPGGDQVLWEEFIQIHRVRGPNVAAE